MVSRRQFSLALTIDALVTLLITFYNNCLMGAGALFDAEGKISIRQLLKSKIFKVFTAPTFKRQLHCL